MLDIITIIFYFSTVSSGTNSVAMTILEVFVRPNLKDMSDEKGIKISRALC